MDDSADAVFIRVEIIDSTRDYNYIVYNEEVSSVNSQSDHAVYIDNNDNDEVSE